MSVMLQDEISETQDLLSKVSGSQYNAIREAQCECLLVKLGNHDDYIEPKHMSTLCETVNLGAWSQEQKDRLYTAITRLGSKTPEKKKCRYEPQVLRNFPSFLSQQRYDAISNPNVPVEKKLEDAALQLVLLECFTPHEKDTYGPVLQFVLDKSDLKLTDDEKLTKLALLKRYVKMHQGYSDVCKPLSTSMLLTIAHEPPHHIQP
jgi:hypothetical protein